MTSIRDIEGLEPKYASMLAENGVRTTEQLLELADTSAKRFRLADQTNIGEDQILGCSIVGACRCCNSAKTCLPQRSAPL